MVKCHECNSEIAEVDTFCPFCGITLTPVKVEDGSDSLDGVEKSDTSDEMSVHDIGKDFESEVAEKDSEDSVEDDEDIDMSETIVVSGETPAAVEQERSDDGGYIDISTLREETETASEFSEESEEDDQNELEVSSESLEESGDDDPESEIEEEVEVSTPEVYSDKPELDDLDDSVEVTEKTEPVSQENSLKDESESPELTAVDNPSESSVNDVSPEPLESALSNELVVSSDSEPESLPVQEKSKTPDEIKDADDSEIDEAVSVIDTKANLWKTDDESAPEQISDVESSSSEESVSIEEAEIAIDQSPEVDEVPILSQSAVSIADEDIPELEEPKAIKLVSDTDEKQEMVVENESDEIGDNGEEIPDPEENIVEVNEPLAEDSDLPDAGNPDVMEDDSSSMGEVKEDSEVRSETAPNIGVNDTDGSKKSKLKPLDEGVVLNGRYEVVRKIGGGGMGAVYLANDKNLGGVLRAVKEMVQSYIEEEQQEKAIQDFKRESMLLTSLDHSSIPTIYDYFFDEKEMRFYLVMKYISGGDLAARLRSAPGGKLDEIEVTDWAVQISDVLDYLHSRTPPIVYRDLKPANIMIDGNSNKVMLIDFGIARWINKEEKGVTAVGTMGYAPPELFSGNVEPSSDIYSLGSTMFHLLTGADPQNNPLLIFDFQKHPRPRQINPQLSDQMERILMRSVEYNAEKRFASAAEMRNSLTEHLENLKAGRVSYGVKETPTAVSLSDQPVFCGFCGQKIVATDMFCAFCGAKQPLAQPGVHSEEYNLLKNTAKLVIEGTTELDFPAFELVKNDNLVGRRDPMSNIFPEVDLSKFDPQTKISRKHARIWRDGETFMLQDLGSSNGTVIIPAAADKSVLEPHQSRALQSGDKIQLGDTILQFMVG